MAIVNMCDYPVQVSKDKIIPPSGYTFRMETPFQFSWYNDEGMLVRPLPEPLMYNRKGQRFNRNDYQWSPSDVYIVPEGILYALERSAGLIRFVCPANSQEIAHQFTFMEL